MHRCLQCFDAVGWAAGRASSAFAATMRPFVKVLWTLVVYLGASEELLLGVFEVLGLASPGGKYGRLQGTPEAEGERPWLDSRVLVDGVEMDRRFLLRLTARQERHSCTHAVHRPDIMLMLMFMWS